MSNAKFVFSASFSSNLLLLAIKWWNVTRSSPSVFLRTLPDSLARTLDDVLRSYYELIGSEPLEVQVLEERQRAVAPESDVRALRSPSQLIGNQIGNFS